MLCSLCFEDVSYIFIKGSDLICEICFENIYNVDKLIELNYLI